VAADLTQRDLEMFVLGLYAGEGSKTDGEVSMANTNPAFVRVFLAGCDSASTPTSSGCEPCCTSTKDSTSTL
jgi:hypothetical protein